MIQIAIDLYNNAGNRLADTGDYSLARSYYEAALKCCDYMEGKVPGIDSQRRQIQHNIETLNC